MRLTRRQIAISVSIGFHAALLAVLFFWLVPEAVEPSMPNRATAPKSDPQAAPPTQPLPRSLSEIAGGPAEVSADEVEKSIQSQIEQANKLSDASKLGELERNLKRLESLANQQSVDDVSSTIAASLGLDVDQYASSEPSVEGSFDVDSAQLSEVQRIETDAGTWHYETVMVDAGGRQMRVPLESAEGARLYETFELMRRYPMARGIYQSVVMPMLQRMLESESRDRADAPLVIQPQ